MCSEDGQYNTKDDNELRKFVADCFNIEVSIEIVTYIIYVCLYMFIHFCVLVWGITIDMWKMFEGINRFSVLQNGGCKQTSYAHRNDWNGTIL